ncbi:carboxypeptidase C [Coprinopsis cinerea okayama7|uniref:Carboxypeptidase n=1 Tax=Coprinopsis cinerea (strain Okayama-7 / 130 / ATCC MYA-4618 / FGSC 9003) TaxID=240176 RepID=A8P9V0_COPC7|nr:carboxypeptidase C [Coprinopsis cinerea okayama7\|eukprot:XP_001839846.2 carboxypeptidase C [Coprinopsis cinerea okayama7\
MRLYQSISLLTILGLVPAYAAPSLFDDAQRVLSNPFLDRARNDVKDAASQYLSDAKKTILKGKKNMEKWIHDGREYIKQDNLLYELVTHPSFREQRLRITEPDLCDSSVQQYSGYLDVAEEKHLFFWFFESRHTPEDAPLILWLNGGPGCSSSTGLLFELGPCSIADEGRNVMHNPYSWNTHANIIFLDQPINVGFSYSDDGSTVNSSPLAGKDVYAFLELFLNRFPQYSTQPFHIAAESYGGTYAPNFASIIHKANKELAANPDPKLKHINLASVVLANGLTDPYIQYGSVADYACDGPYPVYDDPQGPQCQALRGKIPTCQRLVKSCYNYNSRFACVPAVLYCNSQIFAPLMQTGLNPYDVRMKCDRQKDGQLCYKQMAWIENWLNKPDVKASLGVSPDREFASCNMDVNQAFTMNGDGMRNSALLLPELVNDGIRLLVYAGNADLMCNYMGNERWVEAMETKFSQEFRRTKSTPWTPLHPGVIAGEIRSAGGSESSAGNVTYLNIHEAGHMVPFDQPEASLAMITRWIFDLPLNLPVGAEELGSIPPL